MSEKKTQKAIALYYDGETTPTVTATGEGDIAEEIIRLAREHEVPLFENPLLAETLSKLELGEEIPEPLYRCMAQVLAFAWRLTGRTPE